MLITTKYLLQAVTKVYSIDSFKTFEKLINDILNINMTADKPERKQNKFSEKLDRLRASTATGSK